MKTIQHLRLPDWVATMIGLAFVPAVSANAAQVILPDNGGGTVSLPFASTYHTTDPMNPMQIVDGLPQGDTIEITASIPQPILGQEQAGGTQAGYGGAMFQWAMQGTGSYSGYSRNVTFPVPSPGSILSFPTVPTNYFDPTGGASLEIHAAPRTPYAPVQSCDTVLLRGFSQITGDPDFDLLRVTMGTDFGLPSPGHTTLTDMGGGNRNVDSFFDITYRIDFIGASGSPFAGRSGSTTGTAHFQMGQSIPEPAVAGLCAMGLMAPFVRRRSRET